MLAIANELSQAVQSIQSRGSDACLTQGPCILNGRKQGVQRLGKLPEARYLQHPAGTECGKISTKSNPKSYPNFGLGCRVEGSGLRTVTCNLSCHSRDVR